MKPRKHSTTQNQNKDRVELSVSDFTPTPQLATPLFDIIPANFFTPLASPNRLVYWECIHKLFSVMNAQLSFGIEREILADELQFYFEQNLAADFEDGQESQRDPRKKANDMLRLLENYGWIEIETDKSYIQRVNFHDYAVRIIKTLLEIADGKKVEYQGYIYVIYSLVKSNTDHPAVVLQQIMENTDLLITGLKNLNSNIKHYIDELTRHKTVAEIMNALFNDYITNIVDKAYHRLLTSDNVSKFRPEIIERLESHSRSARYVKQTADELAALREIENEKAEELVYLYLHEIIEAFRSMDEILAEINHKNTQYQRAAINRARFLLAGSEDIRGQLKEILLYMNERINEQEMDLNGIYEIAYMDELIRIFGSAFLDEKSFYIPIEGKKEFKPEEIIYAEPDMLLRQEKLKKMTEKMQQILSPERIESYVKSQLGSRNRMQASELPLENVEDLIKMIYIRLYGTRKSMKYYIENNEGKHKQFGEYYFPDFTISIKDRKGEKA
ncbi:MAG TPA: Wadjet anti-phage system protein JetA family protein [Lachnospiraceae bacterium]|nr:Wadjet anti-phage system protein JetA family protein [Lachnospiraceae bacterium]